MSERGVPKNFSFLKETRVAGCALPQQLDTADSYNAVGSFFRQQGITGCICVLQYKPSQNYIKSLQKHGVEFIYIPVPTFGCPTEDQALYAMRFIRRKTNHLQGSGIEPDINTLTDCRNGRVVVHCLRGMGRTGTILACFLGLEQKCTSGDEAIKRVREDRPESVETLSQQIFVDTFLQNMRHRLVPTTIAKKREAKVDEGGKKQKTATLLSF